VSTSDWHKPAIWEGVASSADGATVGEMAAVADPCPAVTTGVGGEPASTDGMVLVAGVGVATA
jgi:hypothetical protein